jgi:lipid II:glycine glycyltransferase (peptidoglycan interpeptide bridge formation enzyme)
MRFLANNEVNQSDWEYLISISKYSSPFQTPDFLQFINSNNYYKAEVFAVEDNGVILALAVVVIQKEHGLKKYFSRRGIIYGGPLVFDENKTALNFLLVQIKAKLSKKVIFIEIRNFFDYKKLNPIFFDQGWNFIPYLNFQINTDEKTINDLLSAMKYNRRREIKLSIKNGAEYGLAKNVEEVREVYEILKSLYAERVKLPLPPFDFFQKFMETDITRVFVVKYENKVIAGSFCTFYPMKNLYTMYYCGHREISKKIFPTSLAVWAAIEFAVKEKIPIVDLMGAGQPDEEYGVRNYKAQFGGDLIEYGRFLNILNPTLYKVGVLGVNILSKLK